MPILISREVGILRRMSDIREYIKIQDKEENARIHLTSLTPGFADNRNMLLKRVSTRNDLALLNLSKKGALDSSGSANPVGPHLPPSSPIPSSPIGHIHSVEEGLSDVEEEESDEEEGLSDEEDVAAEIK
jgi:hypothetical protein